MREVHGNTVNRENEESWSSFVARAGAETRTYLQTFNLPILSSEVNWCSTSFGSARANSQILPRICRDSWVVGF